MFTRNGPPTIQCDFVLSEAITRFPVAAAKLAEYRKQEQGHDQLIARSLDLMGGSDYLVMSEIKDLMSLFLKSTEISFLSFCVLLDLFEGIRFSTERSPLAQQIETHFGQEAARFVQAHYATNRQNDHDQIAIELLSVDPIVKHQNEFSEASIILNQLIALDQNFKTKLRLV